MDQVRIDDCRLTIDDFWIADLQIGIEMMTKSIGGDPVKVEIFTIGKNNKSSIKKVSPLFQDWTLTLRADMARGQFKIQGHPAWIAERARVWSV